MMKLALCLSLFATAALAQDLFQGECLAVYDELVADEDFIIAFNDYDASCLSVEDDADFPAFDTSLPTASIFDCLTGLEELTDGCLDYESDADVCVMNLEVKVTQDDVTAYSVMRAYYCLPDECHSTGELADFVDSLEAEHGAIVDAAAEAASATDFTTRSIDIECGVPLLAANDVITSVHWSGAVNADGYVSFRNADLGWHVSFYLDQGLSGAHAALSAATFMNGQLGSGDKIGKKLRLLQSFDEECEAYYYFENLIIACPSGSIEVTEGEGDNGDAADADWQALAGAQFAGITSTEVDVPERDSPETEESSSAAYALAPAMTSVALLAAAVAL